MIFTRTKRMNSYVYLFGILLVGYVVYYLVKDKIFGEDVMQMPTESFKPAPASIEVRQAPVYPERQIAPSGPNSPNQAAPDNQMVIYRDPVPTDPYNESHESSDIPEKLRHPERSYRPPPHNDNTTIAVQSGIANNVQQPTAANTQQFSEEMIQGGGEFMPGIFANDTFDDASYSAF